MKKRSFLEKLKMQWELQAMGLPAVIWLIIFAYIPMFGIIIAFKNYRIIDNIFTAKWAYDAGFEHFIDLFKDKKFYRAFINTLGISFFKLLVFPIPIIFALLLNELTSVKFKKWVQTISYLPHFLAWIILGGMMINWLGNSGLLNELFLKINLIKKPINFLGSEGGFWFLAVFSQLWKELGWSAIIYLAAIAGVDQTLYEAAKIDGASRFHVICYITIPSIMGTITILFILAVANILNANFIQMLVLGNPLNDKTSLVLDTYVYFKGIRGGQYSFATAVGLFQGLIALFLLFSANTVAKKIRGKGLF